MKKAFQPNEMVPVNCFLLLRLRVERGVKINELVSSTGIPKRELYRFEEFKKPKQGDPLLSNLRRTKYRNIKAIERFYDLEPFSCVVNSDDDISGEDMKFFHFYKLRKRALSSDQGILQKITPKTKAVFFDFDGTLTYTEDGFNSWQKIWVSLGYPAEECFKYYRLFNNERITHPEWCNITLDKFQDRGLCEDTVKDISKHISLIDDVEAVFRILKEKDIKIYIVSGSINTVVKEVLGELWDYVDETRVNLFVYNKITKKLESIVGTDYDFWGKRDFITEKCEEEDINPTETWFVGNDRNDEWAYESGANTLCINHDGTRAYVNAYNEKYWHVEIGKTSTLKSILEHVL